MNKVIALLGIVCLMTACSSSEEPSKNVPSSTEVEKMEGISNSSLISNPVTADEAISPEEAATIEFEEEVFDFGDIVEGESVEHLFKFKNTGKNPLVISHAQGSCGCTVPEWPKDPIAPGEGGEIKVKFNSKGKHGEQNKTVTISANTIPNKTTIRVVGGVETNPETEAAEKAAKADS
ncbi:DUF1573 domain-containing protein [Aureispira anguillae]|uniref:DUF1573 domain-containing protein n=1 Tax=Aureispira anguillae TaxID=2864201 RepID=A0A916DR59_9BACT|nr:DUF1573 domain-containing protein [Aureispira anguillae]BDS10465.1 DUF1573 domain-containing protein [Aureispira anguillae]